MSPKGSTLTRSTMRFRGTKFTRRLAIVVPSLLPVAIRRERVHVIRVEILSWSVSAWSLGWFSLADPGSTHRSILENYPHPRITLRLVLNPRSVNAFLVTQVTSKFLALSARVYATTRSSVERYLPSLMLEKLPALAARRRQLCV